MKKYSLSLISIVTIVLLSSCGNSVPSETQTEASGAIFSGGNTGFDASGKIVPFGAPDMISTQIPKGVLLMKKEYTLPNGEKELLEWAISIDSEGIITSVQVFNPAGTIQKFSKKVWALVLGKKLAGLKIDEVPEAPEATAAFNEFIAEQSK